jgi:hypothetical protein
VRHQLPDLEITIGGRTQRSSSTIATVGAYVVVVASTVSDHAITLTSCYLGAIDGDSAATHLLLTPGAPARLQQRVLPGLQPGETHARACLLDHVAELQGALTHCGDQPIHIDVGPHALQRAAGAWAANDDWNT